MPSDTLLRLVQGENQRSKKLKPFSFNDPDAPDNQTVQEAEKLGDEAYRSMIEIIDKAYRIQQIDEYLSKFHHPAVKEKYRKFRENIYDPILEHYNSERETWIEQVERAHTPGRNISYQGRNGDTAVGHLTPGEIVVPRSAQTPELLQHIALTMGDNMPRYVVGSGANSFNPLTGAQEFYDFGADIPGAEMAAALGDFDGGGWGLGFDAIANPVGLRDVDMMGPLGDAYSPETIAALSEALTPGRAATADSPQAVQAHRADRVAAQRQADRGWFERALGVQYTPDRNLGVYSREMEMSPFAALGTIPGLLGRELIPSANFSIPMGNEISDATAGAMGFAGGGGGEGSGQTGIPGIPSSGRNPFQTAQEAQEAREIVQSAQEAATQRRIRRFLGPLSFWLNYGQRPEEKFYE